MPMIDLMFLTKNRLEFTKASLQALLANTNWNQVARLFLYDDDSTDGTEDYLLRLEYPVTAEQRFDRNYGSPVKVMNEYLSHEGGHVFAKIDNDTMVPPGWLDECLKVMDRHPELDFLGIEAFNLVVAGQTERSYRAADFIGGIGLMRTRAFATLPTPHGRFGFTEWQQNESPEVKKGWINPSLPVFLLDHLPREPWLSLSREYVAKGWQRIQWGPYEEKNKALWEWWCE
jgi:glycosyltransferase involved in cell wall biosynthesis